MRKFILFILSFVSVPIFAVTATAQQSDIDLKPSAGVYTVKVQSPSDADMAKICVERVDVSPSVELGCMSASANEIVVVEVTVPITLNDDAELRAFAYDLDGNKSDASSNAGIIDFTNPGAPTILP